ncbi:UNVERIFIED_CONTAM: hypothetical protein FKN15_077874 [Acipenser sinensis]
MSKRGERRGKSGKYSHKSFSRTIWLVGDKKWVLAEEQSGDFFDMKMGDPGSVSTMLAFTGHTTVYYISQLPTLKESIPCFCRRDELRHAKRGYCVGRSAFQRTASFQNIRRISHWSKVVLKSTVNSTH